MASLVAFNGVDISCIPVINRPSYFLVNNYGHESYMSIVEPMEDYKRTPERAVLAGPYKSVSELIAGFKEEVPCFSEGSKYNRKDTEEVFFMGFRWRVRPNHRSFYGNISASYELLPVIARWIALTGRAGAIDNKNKDYLPLNYLGGTGKGFGGQYAEPPKVDESSMALDKHVEHVQKTISNNVLIPIAISLRGSYLRAAQMNIVPKVAFEVYDALMHSIWNNTVYNVKSVQSSKYVMSGTDIEQHAVFLGGFYGAAKIPEWATEISTGSRNGVVVSIVKIKANTIEEAESLMVSLEKK